MTVRNIEPYLTVRGYKARRVVMELAVPPRAMKIGPAVRASIPQGQDIWKRLLREKVGGKEKNFKYILYFHQYTGGQGSCQLLESLL